MSRCFPYPPPGYLGTEESSLTLIESIKLQREWESVKAKAKKDRKREKKERKKEKKDRKEKKEKSKRSVLPEKEIHKSSTANVTCLPDVKLLETENEQLERSSLTEEHAIQASEQKPSTSSDSTHTSSKRKREEVNSQVNSIRGTGNVIRIRLSSRKQNAEVSKPDPCSTSHPIESSSQKQNAVISRQPCSASGRTQLTSCNKHQGDKVDVPSVQQGNNNLISVRLPKPEANQTCSPLIGKLVTREGNTAAVSQFCENKLPVLPPIPEREASSALVGPKGTTREDDVIVRDPKSLNKKLVKAASRYNDLFTNWVPPPPQRELEPDDQDWLFVKKQHPDNQSGDKRLKPSNIVACGSSSLLFPRAQFIPEADIYALPFTVPF